MSNFLIPFGRGFLEVPYTNNLNVEVIDLPENQEQDETALIAAAFKKLNFEKIAGASSIGVVVSDLSRPIPNEKILKVFWTELKSFDISKNKLCFYIASGLHKPANQQEIELILGSYFSKEFKVVVHDARSSVLQRIGVTSRGTPVQINKEFVKAEVKIVIGSVQPHQIVGYSGGTKSVAIGLGGEEFITSNH
jgi:nickel-dependent lactate racemase